MITTAEIQSIDYNSNSCTVRIPVFETVNSDFPAIATAKFATLPGIFNGYLVGDMVWIGFIHDCAGQPVILGKIYQGIAAENVTDDLNKLKVEGGTVHCSDFIASNTAKIPADTAITGVESDYNSLIKIIQQLKSLALYGTVSGADGEKITSAVKAVTVDGELTGLNINGVVYPVTSSGIEEIINGGTASTPESEYTETVGGGNASSLVESEIPPAPSSSGRYVLTCTVVDGIKTYTWVPTE